MGQHYIELCSCGLVISQCRCMAPNKPQFVTPNGCRKCKAKPERDLNVTSPEQAK